MDNNDIPIYYTDLPQEELRLLLYYNQIKYSKATSPESREYYQKKIDYISSLIEK